MTSRHRIECDRAEAFLASLPDDSVGLILTDPPYFRVKELAWDRAWSNADEFVAWLERIAREWRRALKPNGTLVCFAGANPRATRGATMAARVEVMLATMLNVIASVVWAKPYGRHLAPNVRGLRAPFPQTERVVICEQLGSDTGYRQRRAEAEVDIMAPLRDYLTAERDRSGLTRAQLREGMYQRTGARHSLDRHAFSRSQWAMPSWEQFKAFGELLNAEGDPAGRPYLTRGYGDLHATYKSLRESFEELRAVYEELRRPYNAAAGTHHTDVWTYAPAPQRAGRHPCEKPWEMARDLVLQCSREGDVVLDPFCGSGVFLQAAASHGRIAWGCDLQERWANAAREAVLEAAESASRAS